MTDFFLGLAVMAGVTYLIRMLPLVLIRRKITNRFLLSFLAYIPYAVLSAMTFPAVLDATGNRVTALAGLAVGLVAAFLGRGLLTVALTASLAALLSGLVMLL